MNIYKDICKRKKTMNDINQTTGLLMSGGGIDAGGTPYGGNAFDNGSSSSDNGSYESSGSDFNNIIGYKKENSNTKFVNYSR